MVPPITAIPGVSTGGTVAVSQASVTRQLTWLTDLPYRFSRGEGEEEHPACVHSGVLAFDWRQLQMGLL